MVTVVAFEFSVMRCQPLRRALGAFMMMLDQSLRTNSCND
ncbi:acetyltransferase [Vibrio cholerae]|nr:acetyltransferase [Vibrio cholerae]